MGGSEEETQELEPKWPFRWLQSVGAATPLPTCSVGKEARPKAIGLQETPQQVAYDGKVWQAGLKAASRAEVEAGKKLLYF